MEVFISYSGPRSEAVAKALRDWLPVIVQRCKPWMASEDTRSGARWFMEISRKLNDCDYGILVLTRDNLTAPWILFEAGALAKRLDSSLVCPYLVDMTPADIPQGPLSQFQAKQATREGTLGLVRSLNAALGTEALSGDQLMLVFGRMWPDLERSLKDTSLGEPSPEPRSTEEKIDEILSLVRSLSTQWHLQSLWLHTEAELRRVLEEVFQACSEPDAPGGRRISPSPPGALRTPTLSEALLQWPDPSTDKAPSAELMDSVEDEDRTDRGVNVDE